MEPLSALSLFCNIADICNYSIKVFKECREIYTSVTGYRAQDEALLEYLGELQQILKTLRSSASKLGRDDSYKFIVGPLDRMEAQVSAALHLLNEFRANKSGSRLATVIAAAKVAWGQAKLDRTLEELKQHRDDVLFGIAQSTRVQIADILAQTDRLNRGQQSLQSGLKYLSLRLGNLANNLSDLPHMLKEARRISEDVHTELCAISILGRLGNANQRYGDVTEAEPHTFHWILQDNFDHQPDFDIQSDFQTQNDARERLQSWLVSGNGIFHISGKPGSGKSTLMKYLVQHPAVISSLQEWASPKRLALGKFFFWKPDGTQNSREALVRGLLYSIIHYDAKLVHSAFPKCSKESFEHLSLKSTLQMADEEISKAFNNLVNHSTVSEQFNFCFFVDGLDELDEDKAATYSELITMLQNWLDGATGFFKICVSSRHIPVFDNMPVDHRIRLQDLTKHDIFNFVHHSLQSHPIFQAERKANSEDCQKLIEAILQCADGVFLWVKLVLRSVQRGLSNADSIAVLHERVKRTPRALEELFKTLLDSIEDCHADMAVLLLAVAMIWTRAYEGLPCNLSLSMCRHFFNAIETSQTSSVHTAFQADNPPKSFRLTAGIVTSTKSKVCFRCKGLLETVPTPPLGTSFYIGGYVKFLHRSIFEFLERWIPTHMDSHGLAISHVQNTMCWLLWAETNFLNSSIISQRLCFLHQWGLRCDLKNLVFATIGSLHTGAALASDHSTAFELLNLMENALLPPSSIPGAHGTGDDGKPEALTWNIIRLGEDCHPLSDFCWFSLPLLAAAETGFRAYVRWKLTRATPSPVRRIYLQHCLTHALILLLHSPIKHFRGWIADCTHIFETLVQIMGADINTTVPRCCGRLLLRNDENNSLPSVFDTLWIQILFHPEYQDPEFQRDAFHMIESLLVLGGLPRSILCVGRAQDGFRVPLVFSGPLKEAKFGGTIRIPIVDFRAVGKTRDHTLERLHMMCGRDGGVITLETMVALAKPSNIMVILSLIKRNLWYEEKRSAHAKELRHAERPHAALLDKHGIRRDSACLCYSPPPPDQETDPESD